MSLLQNLANKQIIVCRLTTVSGNRQAYATTTVAVAEIQPLSAYKASLIEGVATKQYVAYCDSTVDVQENDRLREVSTGHIFKVKTGGVSRRVFGSIDFLSISLELVN